MIRESCLAVAGSLFLVLVGCMGDAVRLTFQSVEVCVADAASGAGIAGATVEYAHAPPSYCEPVTNEEWLDRFEQDSPITDDSGCVSFDARILSIYPAIMGVVLVRDPLRDQITGEPWLFYVQTQPAQEILEVEMRPGEVFGRDHFALTIMSIGEARFDSTSSDD